LNADTELLFSVENAHTSTDAKTQKTKALPFSMITVSPNDQIVVTVTGSVVDVSQIYSLKISNGHFLALES
jgi:hypothetical protein